MTDKKDEALKLALEALEHIQPSGLSSNWAISARTTAIAAIREALEQPKQESPYKVGERLAREGKGLSDIWGSVEADADMAEAQRGYQAAIREALEQPDDDDDCEGCPCGADGGTTCGANCLQLEQPQQADVPETKCGNMKQPQDKQIKLSCGVDFADGLLTVSVMREHTDGSMEVIHCEQIDVPFNPQQEPVAESTLMALARRCLWIAYCWNDHNFDAAHTYARKEAEAHGITSFEQANDWLTTTPPRREWVGLTEAAIETALMPFDRDSSFDDIARAIEALCKENNA